MGEGLEKLIKDIPRDPALISLFKKIASSDPLPAR